MDTNNNACTQTRKSLRVFLVEDSELVRQRLEELVDSISGTCRVGFAVGADAANQRILDTPPDAVVLDIRLAEGSGFDVLRAVHDAAPDIAVFMLSNFASTPYRRMAQRLGAAEFFDKTTELDRVRDMLAERARVLN